MPLLLPGRSFAAGNSLRHMVAQSACRVEDCPLRCHVGGRNERLVARPAAAWDTI